MRSLFLLVIMLLASVIGSPLVGATATVLSPAAVSATMQVNGPFFEDRTIFYTIELTNSSSNDQQNNPGPEFTNVLPSQLALISGLATSGSTTTDIGTNTVTWDGMVPAGGTATIVIQATINAGTAGQTVSNQASVHFDGDGDGTNESTVPSDNPGLPGASDPTSFVVNFPVQISGTKTVSGNFTPGGTVFYTIVLPNTADFAQADNVGDEFVDVLPSQLHLAGAIATIGTVVADIGTNTVTWNGAFLPNVPVTITIEATIDPDASGPISNQGTVNFDGNGNGTNESTVPTDDPALPGAADPTVFQGPSVTEVPTLGARSAWR